MATLSPPLEVIHKLNQHPESGELQVLQLLSQLPDEYEIYFQSYMNGDRPDVIIVRPGGGVLIIEVKDWNLTNYYVDEETNWRLRKNDALIKSPIKQVESVRDNMINLHIDGLYNEIKQRNSIGLCLKTCVVFTRHSTSEVQHFLLNGFGDEQYNYYRRHLQYANVIGLDSLQENPLWEILDKNWISRQSLHFNDVTYGFFKRHFQSPMHLLEEGKEIIYTNEQLHLIQNGNVRQKIKGPAGSGKTMVLAKRAINSYKRHQSEVLILSFNITLKNYIKDRISDVKEAFPWTAFHITNYHQFFKGAANKYGLKISSLSNWQDRDFFDGVEGIQKYSAIYIDEVQDFKEDWLRIIDKYFLKEGGEFVVFGDEKQNIYDLPLSETREPRVPTVPGAWNRSLKTSVRFKGNLAKIARDFQQRFFESKYNISDLGEFYQPSIQFEKRKLEYYNISQEATASDIAETLKYICTSNDLHPGDVAVLSAAIDDIRPVEQKYRNRTGERTSRTFETEEEHEEMIVLWENAEDKLKRKLKALRRRYKLHFYPKAGLIKFSTIHSFKGWESDSLIIFLKRSEEFDEHQTELIYTGLTRARKNLFVLNGFDPIYHDFFKNFEPD